ncbi:Integrase [Tardiphaga sp. OK246]|uniref:tyrosine-type recombinase/integrase n=1 Tax=Tardiphaga sp. OK246 TaxID=1855307 RepID=UPI000B6ED737|nr:site-specific integrase [Tardiphaga sp. OK246]SNT49801.1 Integrase [Tardiphaga sp. OK246]
MALIDEGERTAKPRKAASRLTVLFVNSAKTPPGMHSDGGNGLYLAVRASGSRSWIFRYRQRGTGKLREMGLGSAGPHGVPLQDARDRAAALKADLRADVDPLEAKRALPILEAEAPKKTFGVFALTDWLPAYAKGFKNPRSEKELRRLLELHATTLFPMALDAITKTEVLAVLAPIWATKPKSARELRAKIETILQAATPDHRQGENPARWRGNLEANFGRDTKAKRKLRIRKHPAVPYAELPTVVQALRARHIDADTSVNLALEFLILTAGRTNEIRSMVPTEVNLDAKIWVVPAARMKSSEPHTVPLSPRAIEILKAVLKPNRPFVFEGLQKEGDEEIKPLGHNAMAHALKAVAPGYTPHGLRSSFRDWAGDETEFPREIVEHALAHTLGDESEKAYRRGRAVERRRPLMEAWADFLR